MQAYKKVLVAIDLEHEAEAVIKKALAVSAEDTNIHVVYVVTPLTDALYANGLGLVSPMLEVEDLQQEAIKASKARLTSLVSSFTSANIKADVLVGDTVRTLVDEAKDIEAQVIVIGSHGKKGLQLLLGSTASGVLHHAGCDVLAVRL
ncbi:MAG: universal stress protein [Pseudomonadales bacterium]|nr:universal stress protein [Pseudomonadales bacterium]